MYLRNLKKTDIHERYFHSRRVSAHARHRSSAFSMIEVMIAVVIAGILAAIAYPAYQQHVREGRRTDAAQTLLSLQLAQIKWRTTHGVYTGNLTDLGWASGTSDSREGHYTIQIIGATAYAFTATATPKTGGLQAADSCIFTVNQDGPVLSTEVDRRCWRTR